MSPNTLESPDISALWGHPLQPASCPKCDVAHLIPSDMENALCPACYDARLEPQPTLINPEPPELILDYTITPSQIRERFQDWLKGIWLHSKELNADILTRRLTRTFIPLWLIDGKVIGTWQAQMGYDYQVASSQEVFNNGNWTTHKLTETRIRWEPRSGTAERVYHNLRIPALNEHNHLITNLGKFKLKLASNYMPTPLERASIRVPSLLPEAAWPLAETGFDRLVAEDCRRASGAQHIDEFIIEADYQDQNWTQLLLPVFTTAYRDEYGKVHPILINGQNGKIFGVKLASQRLGRNWSLALVAVTLILFAIGLLFAAGTALLPLLGFVSLVFFASALFIGIIAPIPAIWAWNFNRSKDEA